MAIARCFQFESLKLCHSQPTCLLLLTVLGMLPFPEVSVPLRQSRCCCCPCSALPERSRPVSRLSTPPTLEAPKPSANHVKATISHVPHVLCIPVRVYAGTASTVGSPMARNQTHPGPAAGSSWRPSDITREGTGN